MKEELVYEGLKQIFEMEFSKLDSTIVEALIDAKDIHKKIEGRLINAFNKIDKTFENSLEIKNYVLKEVLNSGHLTAFEIERAIEDKLKQETQKLLRFATAFDQVHQYLQFSNGKLNETDLIENSPMIEQLKLFESSHKISFPIKNMSVDVSSISSFGAGKLVSILGVYKIIYELRNISLYYEKDVTGNRESNQENYISKLSECIQKTIRRDYEVRNELLEIYVNLKFEELRDFVVKNLVNVRGI